MKLKIISFITIWGVIFNNFHLGGSILLTDILYSILVLLIFTILFAKKLTLDNFSKLLIIFIVYLLSTIAFNYIFYKNTAGLLSQYRFLWGSVVLLFLYVYFKDRETIHLKRNYINLILFSSVFIILQNVSFHLLKFHFMFTFGDFDLIKNSSFYADPSNPLHLYIRSGGLFREPSWFAIFAMPSIYFLYKSKDIKKLIIIVGGLVLSTSSLGYLFLIFLLTYIVLLTKSPKIKIYTFLLVFSLFIGAYVVYTQNEFIFERLFFVLETGGSIEPRLLEPIRHLIANLSFFGVDTTFIKSDDERLFIATLLYVIFSFGFIGLLLFFPLIVSLKLRYIYFSMSLFLIVLIEGLSGRIDFWVLILIFLLTKSNKLQKVTT